jgi:hypothetical protein
MALICMKIVSFYQLIYCISSSEIKVISVKILVIRGWIKTYPPKIYPEVSQNSQERVKSVLTMLTCI